jgi:hypothetical protein
MALVNHCHEEATFGVFGMMSEVQHGILKRRLERVMSKVQTERTRETLVMGM